MLGTLLLALMAITPTDQTVQVAKGTKLDVNNFAGDVNIKVWDKDAVRVEVNNSDRETVDIKQGRADADHSLALAARRPAPLARLHDQRAVVDGRSPSPAPTPTSRWKGVGGDVSVETTHGDVKVRGGSGFVSLKSVQGEITLEKAKGRIEVRAVNESIHLADINGDLSAESTNGSIILDRIDSGNVDLYTVNGNISYDGADQGQGALPPDHAQRPDRDADRRQGERHADGADLQRRLPLDLPDRRPGQAQQALHRHARQRQRARRARVVRRHDLAAPAERPAARDRAQAPLREGEREGQGEPGRVPA